MYEFMEGTPESMDAKGNVVFHNVVAGTGYSIRCLMRDWPQYQDTNGEMRLHIRARFSEQRGYSLFGFYDISDRTAFDLLVTVKGVAGAAAMAILEMYTLVELAVHVRAADVKAIAKAKGVGPKLATQIAVELKLKMEDVVGDVSEKVSSTDEAKAADALVALGYRRESVLAALRDVGAGCVDEYIRKAIAKLM